MSVERIVINEEMAIGFGAAAGGWSTTIIPLSGGKVSKNKNRAVPVRRYDLQYNHKDISVINDLQAFIDNMEGSFKNFLLKDWSNYQLTDHTILTASGGETEVQIKQIWGTSNQLSRTLRYLKAGTLTVKKNGVALSQADSPGEFDVDSLGLITFAVALSPGDVITVTVEFYVPVYFEEDLFMVEVHGPSNNRYGKVPRITLVEFLE